MATITEKTYQSQPASVEEGVGLPDIAKMILAPLASLKVTVALFAMAIFIIWVGTLAQAEKDMWDVIHDYFWTPLAWIELQFLLPFQWLPFPVDIPWYYAFPFPGGATIGIAMAVNLLAAHLVRFKVQGKGMELVAGAIITAIGAALTVLVIVSGHNSEGLQAAPPFEWTTLWTYIKVGCVLAWFGLAFPLLKIDHSKQKVLSWIVIIASVLTGTMLIALFTVLGDFYPGDPALRIMWQLIQGGFAGIVILIGCLFLFKKRAGIVVIHLSVGLLLIGESFVSYFNVEEQMSIVEGEKVNYGRDIRVTELAIVDTSGEKKDIHTVIPERLLKPGEKISSEELPFNLEVVEYYKNSDFENLDPDDENPATIGNGLLVKAVEKRAGSGADSNSEVDIASAYVRVKSKEGEDLGTYLVSQILTVQDKYEKVNIDGKTYDMGLRFKRNYKPYSILLNDVQKNDYIGTMTPKDYRSVITLHDPSRGTPVIERREEIWMNNPLRYAGETFYQSGYNMLPGGKESTTLQVVTNTGWMIPYVACMMALIGMIYHFGLTLVRFANRVMRQQAGEPLPAWSHAATGIATALALLIMVYSLMPQRGAKNSEFNLPGFAELPVIYKGRTKPVDTLARNSLQAISDTQSFTDADDNKQPAVRWLLDLVAKPDVAENHEVFRIRNHEVQKVLGLERRKGDRFSLAEIVKTFDQPAGGDEKITKAEALQKEIEEARELSQEAAESPQKGIKLSAYQRGLLDFSERFQMYQLLVTALRPRPLPSPEVAADSETAMPIVARELMRLRDELPSRRMYLQRAEAPLFVPDHDEGEWDHYSTVWDEEQKWQWISHLGIDEQDPDTPETAKALNAIFAAYSKDNVKQFNQAIARYDSLLDEVEPAEYDATKVGFEAYFNHSQPFLHSMILYLIAFVVAAIGLLVAPRELNWASYGILVVAFILHTLAIAARVYISDRPPVTNLYSSAVFIGWAVVAFCLAVEAIYQSGLVNLLAGIAGVSTLIVAMLLGLDGDTFTVLQAVLDTQFWLTTHVICITLGYATTFLAGLFGVAYLIVRIVSPEALLDKGKEIIRMCYGAVCFAIFFSFLGTVLGGLWADDSWGRFWGWDPKENGALIIVLWNAIILHARWGAMVKDRGLAMLAVAGNIVTSWSWFGVNQLGIGLHSYGFTSGVVMALALFVLSQMAIMALGLVPTNQQQVIEAKPAD